mmetsp:Transcript_13650/g.61293  ORF Transcript_13650/g.61293 Transcript_13650/m.61293 type:complete len:583 (+) Transcript_13650:1302-3050(+)
MHLVVVPAPVVVREQTVPVATHPAPPAPAASAPRAPAPAAAEAPAAAVARHPKTAAAAHRREHRLVHLHLRATGGGPALRPAVPRHRREHRRRRGVALLRQALVIRHHVHGIHRHLSHVRRISHRHLSVRVLSPGHPRRSPPRAGRRETHAARRLRAVHHRLRVHLLLLVHHRGGARVHVGRTAGESAGGGHARHRRRVHGARPLRGVKLRLHPGVVAVRLARVAAPGQRRGGARGHRRVGVRVIRVLAVAATRRRALDVLAASFASHDGHAAKVAREPLRAGIDGNPARLGTRSVGTHGCRGQRRLRPAQPRAPRPRAPRPRADVFGYAADADAASRVVAPALGGPALRPRAGVVVAEHVREGPATRDGRRRGHAEAEAVRSRRGRRGGRLAVSAGSSSSSSVRRRRRRAVPRAVVVFGRVHGGRTRGGFAPGVGRCPGSRRAVHVVRPVQDVAYGPVLLLLVERGRSVGRHRCRRVRTLAQPTRAQIKKRACDLSRSAKFRAPRPDRRARSCRDASVSVDPPRVRLLRQTASADRAKRIFVRCAPSRWLASTLTRRALSPVPSSPSLHGAPRLGRLQISS